MAQPSNNSIAPSDKQPRRPPELSYLIIGVIVLAGIILLAVLAIYAVRSYPDLLGLRTATPLQPLPSWTPRVEATATAACLTFLSQFPGTPCPEEAIPLIEVTLTVDCQHFEAIHPGTPCP